MTQEESTKLSVWIETSIREFVKSQENSLGTQEHEPAWAEPIVGFSRGDDALYFQFKKDIGPFYWTPLEIFEKTFPGISINPSELTVISWVLPQTDKTKQDNRKETKHPSERWARSRKFGGDFNVKLRDQVVALLTNSGYAALAPSNSSYFEIQTSDRFGAASTWSERHAAYVSGLGTFGLCNGLITPVGKAMRCGSVIARISLPPTKRRYNDHHAYCLFFSKGICGQCIKRCPAGAITEQGHNKETCIEYVYTVTSPYVSAQFGFDSYGCGLCQTKVPCECGIPSKVD